MIRSFISSLFLLASSFLLLTAAHAAVTAPVPVLGVDALGKSTVLLDGPWQFHEGDNPGWASPALDDTTGHEGWGEVETGRPWGEQGHYAYSGIAWYRRHIDFAGQTGDAAGGQSIRLYIPTRAACKYEVYWNGLRITPAFGSLRFSNYFSAAESIPIHPLQSGVLAIRAWTPALDSSASGSQVGLTQVPLLGTAEALAARETDLKLSNLRVSLVEYAKVILYCQVIFVGLVAWLRNRRQRELLWIVLFLAASILFLLIDPIAFPWLSWLQALVSAPIHTLEDVALWYLLLYLLEVNTIPSLRRLAAVLVAIAVPAACADDLVFGLRWSVTHAYGFQVLDAIFTAVFSLAQLFPFVILACAIRRRLNPARWLVAAAAFVVEMYDVVQHTALQGQRFTHWTLGDTMLQPWFSIGGVEFYPQDILSTLLVLALGYAVYRYSVEERESRLALEQEYRSAQELQRVLIPETLPSLSGYAVTSAYQPAQQVGGDFFQLIAQPDGSALLALGDVSGKGLKAAMTVSLIVGALRTLVEVSDDPALILAGLNRRLYGRLQNGFATCLVLRLDSEGGCAIANAGHPAPFLNRQEIASPGALPLGLDPTYRYEVTTTRLAVGDQLTLYTDGLLEARNSDGELYGFERLRTLMAGAPDARLATEAAIAFGQEDDITVLTLIRLAVGVESTTSLNAPQLAVVLS